MERWAGCGVVGVVHGALLGPETTGPDSLVGGLGVLDLVPAPHRWWWVDDPFGVIGRLPPVVWGVWVVV